MSDVSGYYVSGIDSSLLANIWKHLFSSTSTYQCQQISNFQSYAFGQIKLSDSIFFMLGYHPSSPYPLHLYKFTFGSTSPLWSLTMTCPSGIWSANNSESLLISSSIYSFFIYGSVLKYVYLAIISLSDGAVTSRYKSSSNCNGNMFGSGVIGDIILITLACPSSYLIIYNKATNAFNTKSLTDTLIGIASDTINGR